MEGNGLLVPFGEQEYGMRGKSGSSENGTKRAVRATRFRSDRDVFGEKAPMPGSLVAKRAHRVPPPFDGPSDGDGSKEDDDEDAINSDLDDPEDPLDDEDNGDESVGQVMLCTYDKVQRVKSKWKCTLKDGILSTNGREYDSLLYFYFGRSLIATGTCSIRDKESLSGEYESVCGSASWFRPGCVYSCSDLFCLRLSSFRHCFTSIS